jgi:hypothetical protein
VIEAEPQAVLNALTERDFQDPFTKMAEELGTVLRAVGDYFEGDGGQ